MNADGGGTRVVFKALIDAGVAEVWDIDLWGERSLYLNLERATQGYWPSDLSTPNSPLLPPFREWRECTSCKKDSGASGLTMVAECASCKTKYPAGTLLPVKREPINGIESVGFWGFEGMTSYGEQLLRRLNTADSGGGNYVTDGKDEAGNAYKITNPGQSHYGMTQSHLLKFIHQSRNLPGPFVGWTALERAGVEDGTPVYGPAGPGKALTASCIPKFTAVIHLDVLAKREKGVVVKDANGLEILDRKFFLAPHFPADQTMHRFLAKVALPEGAPPLPATLPADLPAFFVAVDEAAATAQKSLA